MCRDRTFPSGNIQTSSVSSELLPFDNSRINSRQKSYSFYVQDQWQVGRKLTVSLGLRWDYFPTGSRLTRGMERYDFGVPADCGYNIEQKNFSPRVGLFRVPRGRALACAVPG